MDDGRKSCEAIRQNFLWALTPISRGFSLRYFREKTTLLITCFLLPYSAASIRLSVEKLIRRMVSRNSIM